MFRFSNILFVLLLAIPCYGQVNNPTSTIFTPSPDHDVTDPNTGAFIVDHYDLQLIQGSTGSVFVFTQTLGKPTPVNGSISVVLSQSFLGAMQLNTLYSAKVNTVGPGGSSESANSNTFQNVSITPPPPCVTSLSSNSLSVNYQAGSSTFNVIESASNCAWSAIPNATWIVVTAGNSGVGSGSITYSYQANPDTSSGRTGTISVNDQIFTLIQGAAPLPPPPCVTSISPTSANYTAGSATGAFNITESASNCTWAAVAVAGSFITITSPTSGVGSAVLNYSITANNGAARSGTITVNNQTFTINQAAFVPPPPPPCSIAISPASATFSSSATTASFNVIIDPGCAWTTVTSATWITYISGASGTGNGTVNYSVSANTSITSSRSGTITVTSSNPTKATFNITQNAAPAPINPPLPQIPVNVRITAPQ